MSRLFAASKSRVFTASLALLLSGFVSVVGASPATAADINLTVTLASPGGSSIVGDEVYVIGPKKTVIDSTTVLGAGPVTMKVPQSESGTVFVMVRPASTDTSSAFTSQSVVAISDTSTTVLLAPVAIRGTVTGPFPDTSTVKNVDVSCLQVIGQQPTPVNKCSAKSNKSGYYAIPALPWMPGPVRVFARGGTFVDWMSSSTPETPTATRVQTVDIALQQSNLVVAVNAGLDPAPEQAVDVELRRNGSGFAYSNTRADGRAYFLVDTQTYTVIASPANDWVAGAAYDSLETTTSVPFGQTQVLNLDLPAAVSNLRIRAYSGTDTPVVGVGVERRTWNPGSGWFQGPGVSKTSSSNGTADFNLTEPGQLYRFVVSGKGNLTQSSAIIKVETATGALQFKSCPFLKFNFGSQAVGPTGVGSCSEIMTVLDVDTETQKVIVPVQLLAANFRVRVGSIISLINWANVSISKWNDAVNGFQNSGLGDQTNSAGTAGIVGFALGSGVYQVMISPPDGMTGVTDTNVYIKVNSDNTVQECSSINSGVCTVKGAVPVEGGVPTLTVPLSQSNATWRIVSSGAAVTKVNVNLQKRVGSSWAAGSNVFTNETNTASLTLETSTVYQVNVTPSSGTATSANFIIIVGSTASPLTISKCASSDFDYGTGLCMKTVAWQPVSAGVWDLELLSQNFWGVACQPTSNPCDTVTATDMRVEVLARTANPGGYGYYFSLVSAASVDRTTGQFGLSLADGQYRIVARRPFNATGAASAWTDTTVGLKVASGGTEFVKCSDINAENCTDTQTVSASSPFKLKFAKSNFQAKVVKSSDTSTAVPFAWVELMQPNPSQCDNCRTQLQGTSANNTGSISLQLSAGSYILGVNPPNGLGSSDVRTEYAVTVSGASGETVSVAGATNVGGVWNLPMKSANVNGFVKSAGVGVAYADVQVEKNDGDFWQPAQLFTRTDSTGSYALFVPYTATSVTYRLRVQPPSTGGTALASTTSKAFQLSTDTPTYSETITLGTPNVSGTVVGSSGAAVAWAWIQVDKWDELMQNFVPAPAVPGTNTNATGGFALTLPQSSTKTRWRLTINPQPNTSFSKKSKELWVKADTSTVYIDEALTTLLAKPFTETLTAGNIAGTVSTSDNRTATSGWVNVEKYDATLGYWQWVDLWANVGPNGTFNMNISNAGSYRLTVNPPFGDSTNSRTMAYVVAESSSKLCTVSTEQAAKDLAKTPLCNSPLTPYSTLPLAVTLTGSNVTGQVLAAGVAVRDVWINVQQYDSKFGNWTWLGGANTNSSGNFALTLDPGTYRLEVNPPWNSTAGYARQNVTITKVANATLTVPTIVLNSGNLSGKVTELTETGTAVAYTGIQVEKWAKAPWDPTQFTWVPADMPMNTRADGTFGGTIPDTTGTIYRFTAFPSGNSTSNVSRASKIIKATVASGTLSWCDYADSKINNSDSSTPFGLCTNRTGVLKLVLTGASVTGKVYASNLALRDVWVGVARTKDATGQDVWQWQGGSPTNATGGFALNIDMTDTGTYRVEFNPPWGSASTLGRFTANVTLSGCAGDGTACTTVTTSSDTTRSKTYTAGTKSLVWDVNFPSVNLSGTVCDPDNQAVCTAVPKAWVNVFEETGTGTAALSTWTDLGSGTDQAGTFKLSGLTAGKVYRLEANPSWENPKGVSSNTFILVCAGGVTYETGTRSALVTGTRTCSSGISTSLALYLGKSNVSGSVVSESTVVSRAWVEVRSADATSFVAGTTADGSGLFKLNLPTGTYLVRFFSGGTVQKAPIQIRVDVGGDGTVSSWKYCGSLADTATACSATGGSGDVNVNMSAAAASASVEKVTINSDMSGKHFVSVFKCTSASKCSGSDAVIDTSFTVVTDDNGDAEAALPAGSWKLMAVALPDETSLDVTKYTSVVTVDGVGSTTVTWPTS